MTVTGYWRTDAPVESEMARAHSAALEFLMSAMGKVEAQESLHLAAMTVYVDGVRWEFERVETR